MIILPQCFCRLDRASSGAAAYLAGHAKSKGTISARHGAVNWKMGKLTRGGKVNFCLRSGMNLNRR
jgi:hypothetical protein